MPSGPPKVDQGKDHCQYSHDHRDAGQCAGSDRPVRRVVDPHKQPDLGNNPDNRERHRELSKADGNGHCRSVSPGDPEVPFRAHATMASTDGESGCCLRVLCYGGRTLDDLSALVPRLDAPVGFSGIQPSDTIDIRPHHANLLVVDVLWRWPCTLGGW